MTLNNASTLNHSELQTLLADYRDLRGAERAAVDEHLRTCAACTARLAEYRAMDRDLAELRDARPDARLRTGYLAAVQSTPSKHANLQPATGRRLPLLSGLAGAVAVLALVFGVLFVLRPGEPEPARGAAETPTSPLANTQWILLSLNGKPAASGTQITLDIEDGKLSGYTGCNRYGTEYQEENGLLQLGMIQQTLQGCADPIGSQEAEYMETLNRITQYALGEDRLELRDTEGAAVLVYRPRPRHEVDPQSLQGREWRLTAISGATLLPDSRLTLIFEDDDSYLGDAGCRAYKGTYQAEADTIYFSFTEMVGDVCDSEARLSQEQGYTTHLELTRHYRVEGDVLELFTEAGVTLQFSATTLMPTPAPATITTTVDAPRDPETTEVTLDIYSGLPNPVWTLTAEQTQELRELLDNLPEAVCERMNLNLGLRGFVVELGQRPELSNEYRLRVAGRQVRWGDPWNPDMPAFCQSDLEAAVGRFLLASGQPHMPQGVYALVEQDIQQADAVPGDWPTYSDETFGFSFAHPMNWEGPEKTAQSRLFYLKQDEPTGPAFPVFYVTVMPEGYTNADFEAYNFWNAEEVAAAVALQPGTSGPVHGAEEYNIYTRLSDVPTVAGLTGVVVESERVWEGGPDTRDRRVLLTHEGTLYMLGTYYTTQEELQVFEQVVATFEVGE